MTTMMMIACSCSIGLVRSCSATTTMRWLTTEPVSSDTECELFVVCLILPSSSFVSHLDLPSSSQYVPTPEMGWLRRLRKMMMLLLVLWWRIWWRFIRDAPLHLAVPRNWLRLEECITSVVVILWFGRVEMAVDQMWWISWLPFAVWPGLASKCFSRGTD